VLGTAAATAVKTAAVADNLRLRVADTLAAKSGRRFRLAQTACENS
jgi:hypothetical protein